MAMAEPTPEKGVVDLTEGYTPFRQQRAFHASSARFRAFVSAIGTGKSIAGLHECFYWSSEAGTVGLACAPTYPMLQRTILSDFGELRQRWPGYVADYNIADRRALFCNGSVLYFSHGEDPDALRGSNLNYCWLDEAAMCPEQTYLVLQGRLRRPGRQGMWITTTPRGRNWVFRRFQESPEEDSALFRARLEDANHLGEAYVRSLRRSYTGAFARQELDAEFVAFEGLVYPEFSEERHVAPLPPKKQWKHVVAGMDFGFVAPGALIVLVEDEHGVVHAAHEEYARHLPITGGAGDDWLTRCRQVHSDFEVETFWCDPAEPRSISDLQRNGINAMSADNDVIGGIRKVSALMTDRFQMAPGCVNLLGELGAYCWEKDREGNPKENEKPEKQGDHACDALRYGVAGLMQDTGQGEVKALGGSGGDMGDDWMRRKHQNIFQH